MLQHSAVLAGDSGQVTADKVSAAEVCRHAVDVRRPGTVLRSDRGSTASRKEDGARWDLTVPMW